MKYLVVQSDLQDRLWRLSCPSPGYPPHHAYTQAPGQVQAGMADMTA